VSLQVLLVLYAPYIENHPSAMIYIISFSTLLTSLGSNYFSSHDFHMLTINFTTPHNHIK